MSFCRVGMDLARSESIGAAIVCGLYLKEPGYPPYPPKTSIILLYYISIYMLRLHNTCVRVMHVMFYVSVRISQTVHAHKGDMIYIYVLVCIGRASQAISDAHIDIYIYTAAFTAWPSLKLQLSH